MGWNVVPRFRLISLLIAFLAMAMWLSTFAAYPGADDIRSFMMLSIIVAAGANAAYSHGPPRAFWGGFTAASLMMGSRILANVSPRFTWLSQVSLSLARYTTQGGSLAKRNMESIQATLFLASWLLMATICGLMCVYIYRRYNRTE
jgi:hypothetical protein